MKYPLISVIIPMYNAEKTISDTINSVINQIYTNWEIIIIDDGSTDNSFSIVQKFVSDKIKIIRVKNGGAAKARNIGFHFSRGEYIQYLDADDLLCLNKFKSQIDLAKKYDYACDILYSSKWIRFCENIKNTIGGVGPVLSLRTISNPFEWLLNRPINLMPVHAWLTPRSLIQNSNGWLESMTFDDDGEFYIRIIGNTRRIIFCDTAIVYYRTSSNKNTLSTKKNKSSLESAYKSLTTYISVLNKFSGKTHEDVIKKSIGNNLIYFAYDVFPYSIKLYNKSIEINEIKYATINFDSIKLSEFKKVYHIFPWKFLVYLRMIKSLFNI